MKTKFFFFIAALAATVAVHAQQISVVAPSGASSFFTDLNLAIQNAQAGSTIYLSGGGFQISDETKIKKKLTIIGIGHRPDNDNADGNTNVSGNFWFEGGSDNSAVLGLYLSGTVYIGTSEGAVNNFLLRYCNVKSVSVKNMNCQDVRINQNYLRDVSYVGWAPVYFSNNVSNGIETVQGGTIINNIIMNYIGGITVGVNTANDCTIKNNIVGRSINGNNNLMSNNLTDIIWGNHFDFPGVLSPNYNYQLREDSPGKNAGTDDKDIGIYGGTGFSPTALPPIPRITDKKIAEQTDENGKLKVQIQVKAQ